MTGTLLLRCQQRTVHYPLSWRFRTNSLAVWEYSPKDHDNHPINVESIAYRPSGGGLAQPEMIIGLRSPLSVDRKTGSALYYRVTDVGAFLPAGGGWSGAATGITGPFTLSLNGQGIRSIEWCPGLGTNATRVASDHWRSANGGPLEKEIVGEKFSLYGWNGTDVPAKLIDDLRPYQTRPEGVAMIVIGGESRVLFVEDRFLATGYGARNAIHWPLSIWGSVQF